MGLKGGKRGKAGAWSTDSSVLQDLADQGHDLPARILAWRQLAKLKSTYTDALLRQAGQDDRVHTSFQMAITSTGRLSSTDPNLQNIPVRTEEGTRIRQAFIAPSGKKLISADYSQIELRLLADVANIPALREAFQLGQDIHARTASEVFNIPLEGMDALTRRRAKAINFGIIYGISAFGLGKQLGIPAGEARTYIDAYFARYPGIRDYMERMRKKHAPMAMFSRLLAAAAMCRAFMKKCCQTPICRATSYQCSLTRWCCRYYKTRHGSFATGSTKSRLWRNTHVTAGA